MTEKKASAKCHNCGEPLEPNVSKCPKCGSGDRDISVEDSSVGVDTATVSALVGVEDKGVGEDSATVNALISVEDKAVGHDMVAISGSLIEGYNQLSNSFTIDQKRIADSFNFAPMLEQLKRTAESNEKLLALQIKASKQSIKNEGRQKKVAYITTAIAIITTAIAVIAWLFPR